MPTSVKRDTDKLKHLVYMHWKDRPLAADRHQLGPAKRHRATRAKTLEAVYGLRGDECARR